ncbi:hypothetical protein ACLOJK_028997 [Asimina triloba]
MYYTSAFCVRLGYGAVAAPFDRHSPAAEETHLAGGRHLSITGSRGDAPRRHLPIAGCRGDAPRRHLPIAGSRGDAPLDRRQQRRTSRSSSSPPSQAAKTHLPAPDRLPRLRRRQQSQRRTSRLPIVFLASVAGVCFLLSCRDLVNPNSVFCSALFSFIVD